MPDENDFKDFSITDKVNYLVRNTEEINTRDELAKKLEKDQLVIKYGVDPTSTEIHLGHLVPILKLKEFQDLGYDITFLIGDFTARIGDPTGKDESRKSLTKKEVYNNAKSYTDQVFKILDPEKTKIVRNYDWLCDLNLEELIGLLSKNTVNNLIKRKSFQNRFDAGKAVHGNELIYPYLQGYDSVELNADIEIGGSDQLFNMMFGRDLQQKYGQEPQVVMTTPLLEGLDGNLKMSKSLGNTVGVEENPNDMYMKIMKVNDELVDKYFSLLTNLNHMQVNSIKNSYRNLDTYEIDLKKKLAYEITSMLHNSSEARDAQENFEKVVQNKDLPTNIEDLCMDLDRKITPLEILQGTNAYSSNSNIRRLIQQRGFSIDGQIVDDPFIEMKLEPGAIIKAGKKNIYKLSY